MLSRVRNRLHPWYAQQIQDRFSLLFYEREHSTWRNTFWHGHVTYKVPADLWVYQEILHELRPDVVVECGTAYGGSALYLAHVLDGIGHGQVITIDVADTPEHPRPQHPRIEYVLGSSVDPELVGKLRARITGQRVMVILDSLHTAEHVGAKLEAWAPAVSVGSYLIVEDTNVNGHPVAPGYGPGPGEAVEAWGAASHGFEVDRSREKHLHTFNPGGYLRRIR